MNTRHTNIETTIGRITLVATGNTLTGIYYPNHWTRPDRQAFGPEIPVDEDSLLSTAADQLRDYLEGNRESFDLPIAGSGDSFQKQVWSLLNEIPFGQTTTYGELAERLGDKRLAQDVGKAVGSNPLSIVVPCHRVVGKNGKLTGYAGGLERKQFLLNLETPVAQTLALF